MAATATNGIIGLGASLALIASLAAVAPALAQVTAEERENLAEQERNLQILESTLNLMERAGREGRCRAFRDLDDQFFSEILILTYPATEGPWRRRNQILAQGCTPNGTEPREGPTPAPISGYGSDESNERFLLMRLQEMQEAQKRGRCGQFAGLDALFGSPEIVGRINSLREGKASILTILGATRARGCDPIAPPVEGAALRPIDRSALARAASAFNAEIAGCDFAAFSAALLAYIAELNRASDEALRKRDTQLRAELEIELSRVERETGPVCGGESGPSDFAIELPGATPPAAGSPAPEPPAPNRTTPSVAGLWKQVGSTQTPDWRAEENGANFIMYPTAGRATVNTTVGVRRGNSIAVSYPPGGGYECPAGAPARDVPDSSRLVVAEDGQSMVEWVRNFDLKDDGCKIILLEWNPLTRYERVEAPPATPPADGEWRDDSVFDQLDSSDQGPPRGAGSGPLVKQAIDLREDLLARASRCDEETVLKDIAAIEELYEQARRLLREAEQGNRSTAFVRAARAERDGVEVYLLLAQSYDLQNCGAAPLTLSRALTRRLEEIVASDSNGWQSNRYVPGSMRNGHVVAGELESGNFSAQGEYTYNVNRTGWVIAKFRNNQIDCLQYHDFADTCRWPY